MTAFFQFCSFAYPRPMRRSLPRYRMVFTSTTVTLKSFWVASLISILLAAGATSKMTWFFSRSWFDFSVRMMGRRMMVSGVSMASSLLEAAGLEGLGCILADDQVVVPQKVVDVHAFGRQIL